MPQIRHLLVSKSKQLRNFWHSLRCLECKVLGHEPLIELVFGITLSWQNLQWILSCNRSISSLCFQISATKIWSTWNFWAVSRTFWDSSKYSRTWCVLSTWLHFIFQCCFLTFGCQLITKWSVGTDAFNLIHHIPGVQTSFESVIRNFRKVRSKFLKFSVHVSQILFNVYFLRAFLR